MQITQIIAPCLWFDSQAEEAAGFYVSVFKNSKITSDVVLQPEGKAHEPARARKRRTWARQRSQLASPIATLR
jgi:predicted 3-demethylubiquinone-9 3-methyltransferase (glyoxalase superfamily)